jgi:hypothetical protein
LEAKSWGERFDFYTLPMPSWFNLFIIMQVSPTDLGFGWIDYLLVLGCIWGRHISGPYSFFLWMDGCFYCSAPLTKILLYLSSFYLLPYVIVLPVHGDKVGRSKFGICPALMFLSTAMLTYAYWLTGIIYH